MVKTLVETQVETTTIREAEVAAVMQAEMTNLPSNEEDE